MKNQNFNQIYSENQSNHRFQSNYRSDTSKKFENRRYLRKKLLA